MKREKRERSFVHILQDSVILSALIHIFEKTHFLLTHGFFARILTSYTEEERLLKRGLFLSDEGWHERAVGIKRRVARAFENSVTVRLIERASLEMLWWQTRSYGVLLLSFGVSGSFVYLIREFWRVDPLAWNGGWMMTAGASLLSVPLLTCREPLAVAMSSSRLLSPVLFQYLGFPEGSLSVKRKFPRAYGAFSAIGIALGVLTYFVSPVSYLVTLGILVAIALIFRAPEIGVLLLMGILPLVGYTGHSAVSLALVIAAVSASYFVKWIRGKRTFRATAMDLSVAAVAVLYVLNGAVSIGGRGSLASAALYAMLLLAYFLSVNLLRSPEWIERAWKTLLFSGLLSCIFGISESFTGSVNASWVDMRSFSQTVRITGGFENPNVYAEYLLMLIPLSFVLLSEQKTVRKRLLAIVPSLILVFCMVHTWSRGAWLGLLLAAVAYLLLMDKRAPLYLLGAVALSPLAAGLLPNGVMARVASIGDLTDSSVSYRFSVWRGGWRMLQETAWCGTGVGHSAFSALYPAFAYGGSTGVRHAHSLYLQMIIEFGIVGFFIMAAVLFLFAQMCLEYCLDVAEKRKKRLVAAGFSSVLGMLFMGLTDHIWYDYRIFLCFWLAVGLASACVRVGREEARRILSYDNNANEARMELR